MSAAQTKANNIAFFHFFARVLFSWQWVRYKDALYSVFLHAHLEKEHDAGGGDDSVSNWQPLPHFTRPVNEDSRFISEIDDGEGKLNEINHKNIERDTMSMNFTADEWFGAVVMQAWFRGSRGRKKARSQKEQKAIDEQTVAIMLRQGMSEIGKKKIKKKKKHTSSSGRQEREGMGGRKYAMREI